MIEKMHAAYSKGRLYPHVKERLVTSIPFSLGPRGVGWE